MENATQIDQQGDLSIAGGCPSCGGTLSVRKTPGAVWGYCAECHQLSRPELALAKDGLVISLRPAAA